ncbi:MAG: quinone-dependent dihydroorotate dehydrogenase [Sphingobacteriia bacterium]|nr:quinone-dependent dihydroorotate dehydrogenase [Sphingobacteriia bacterium]
MNTYDLIRPFLFQLKPESAHDLTLRLLELLVKLPGGSELLSYLWGEGKEFPVQVCGLHFRHPVGLAAGMDKDGRLAGYWNKLGFSFAEIGTVTPVPQLGNPRPRLFRLIQDQALINRMGFNNNGVDALVTRLQKSKPNYPIGGNVGKNKQTPNENALLDYQVGLKKLNPVVDYYAINISSPNTPGLRALQETDALRNLLTGIRLTVDMLPFKRPVWVKISPDLTDDQLKSVCEVLLETNMDGVIAANTTLDRQGLISSPDVINQTGGLSGHPIAKKSTKCIAKVIQYTNHQLPVIGVGGILNPADALDKLDAGATLIQLYTGLVFKGPQLIHQILNKIK